MGGRGAKGTNTTRLPALDGLRGIAALVVVAFHTLRLNSGFVDGLSSFQPHGAIDWWMTITPLRVFFDGHVAVWVFFGLSGYVLSRRYWQGERTPWGRYYIRRFIRLYIPIIASACYAIVVLVLRQSITHSGHGLLDLSQIGTSATQILHNLVLLDLSSAPLNGVWWSMRWELWFSILLMPILASLRMIGCSPQRRFSALPAAIGLFCIATTTSVPWLVWKWHPPTVWVNSLTYLPIFGVGIALAAYEVPLQNTRWRNSQLAPFSIFLASIAACGMGGLLGVLMIHEHLTWVQAMSLSNASTLFGITALVGLCVAWPKGIRALSIRPIAWLGSRSFSLYLVHLPLVHLLADLLHRHDASVWFLLIVVTSSLMMSELFYRFVEAPSIALVKRVGNRKGDAPPKHQIARQYQSEHPSNGSAEPVFSVH